MRTDDWGPMIWTWLHAATLAHPLSTEPASVSMYDDDYTTTAHRTSKTFEQDKAIGQIIILFQCTLPCQLCRKNLSQEITQINDSNGHVADFEQRVLRGEVFSRMRLECILHCLHNSVNKRLEKPHFAREKLYETYSGISILALDIKLMQFLNAVVYVCSVDGLRRDKHVVALLYAFMTAFPFEWRINSVFYQALVGALALTSRESSGSLMAAQIWYSILSALVVATSGKVINPVGQAASGLMGAWNNIIRIQNASAVKVSRVEQIR